MELNRDIELIFTMDDTETSSDSVFFSAPSEPSHPTLLSSPSSEMDRGRTRSRSIPRLASQARNSRADGSSMCRGRTRRRSISPAPGLCTCSCACSACSAVALELYGPSGALCIPFSSSSSSSSSAATVIPSSPLSPTRVFLHQLSFGGNTRRRDAAPCRDTECNKKRMGSRQGGAPSSLSPSSFRHRSHHHSHGGGGGSLSSLRRASSRSRSRSRAAASRTGIDTLQPMSAKSFTSMSRLRYQVLIESGHSDEEEHHNDDHHHHAHAHAHSVVGSPDVPTFDIGGGGGGSSSIDGQLLWTIQGDPSPSSSSSSAA